MSKRKQELHPRTAIINKKQKNQSKLARQKALAWLIERFPLAFNTDQSIRPLKKGIMTDIMAHAEEAEAQGISRAKIREAVVIHTRGVPYLASLKVRDMRIDLAGNPVEEVTEDEAQRANLKIKKRVEKCARNARKLIMAKAASSPPPRPVYRSNYKQPADPHNSWNDNGNSSPEYQPRQAQPRTYQPRQPQYQGVMNERDKHWDYDRQPSYRPQASAAKPATVVIKNKTRAYDPQAVTRLKEKLGIAASRELATEE